MFTGLVADKGEVIRIVEGESSRRLDIRTKLPLENIVIGASVACDGCCLTVVEKGTDWLAFDVGAETLAVTALGEWAVGTAVNLETSLRFGDEMGGHIVSGHVDGLATVEAIEPDGESWRLKIRVPDSLSPYIAPKGSVVLNGISLTINEVAGAVFGICIIPHTWQVTNISQWRVGQRVHVEIDMLARYAARLLVTTESKPTLSLAYEHHSQELDRIFPTQFANVEELLAEIQAGRPVVLVDDEDRENEGDLVLAADFVTPELINFMIRECGGFVCLALAPAIADHLQLPLQARRNLIDNQANFTVSIEARRGVSTGVSAADRALTIKTAIDPNSGPDDLCTPGHIFPLRADAGGVQARAGHTEAGVELAELAGLTGAAVICEIMNVDGTMARLPELIVFARTHNLKLATIESLIAYRAQREKAA